MMTGRERVWLALCLLGAALLAAVAIAAITPHVFCRDDGSSSVVPDPACGCGLIVLPGAAVDAVVLLLGSACVSCFLRLAYGDLFFGAAKMTGFYLAVSNGDAEAGLGKN